MKQFTSIKLERIHIRIRNQVIDRSLSIAERRRLIDARREAEAILVLLIWKRDGVLTAEKGFDNTPLLDGIQDRLMQE